MSTDLSKTSSEVVETNSLREILLFCAVLLVEIYSLAVSFGGPFFEVGYFLLVVISQTFAGAYIWAQLRQSDKTLPLPELLAMGFAIGSASAAISQLIIRDLLGIRLFLSPLIPIIGVAIWLITKRDPQLPVKVTHATTNTLLWLLFPAPLALMTYSMFLLPVFIAPMLLGIYVVQRKRRLPKKLNRNLLAIVSLYLFFGTLLHRYLFAALTKYIIGIDAYADDIRFDVVQAIASAQSGISTNAELVNQNYAYYKVSYLWMAPITNFDSRAILNLSVTVIPVFLISIAGASLWATARILSNHNLAAGISSVLFFTQTNFSGDNGINIRAVWLLGTIYLLSAGVFYVKIMTYRSIESLVILFVMGFVIAGTRITFIPFVIALTFLNYDKNYSVNKNILLNHFLQVTAISLGVLVAILIFTGGENSTLFNSVFLTAADWPISLRTTLNFVANTTLGRIIFFLLIMMFTKSYRKYRIFLTIATLIYCLTQFAAPRAFVMDTVFVFPYVIVLTPLFAILVSKSSIANKQQDINSFILGIVSILSGIVFKICYDMFQSDTEYQNYLKRSLSTLCENQLMMTLCLFIFCAIISYYFTRLITKQRFSTFIGCLIFAVVASNTGILIGNQIRPFTEYVRFGQIFWAGERDPLLARWEDPKLLEGIRQTNILSKADDIVASNFGLSRGTGFRDGIRFQIETPRSIYISGNYEYYLSSFPLQMTQSYSTQTDRARKFSDWAAMISERFNTSMDFPNYPSRDLLANMRKENVKWFVVDLTNTTLRDWEPWATTRFMNEKVAILELAQVPVPSN